MQENTPLAPIDDLANLIAKNDFKTFKEKYLANPDSHQFSKEELDAYRYSDEDTLLHKTVQNNGLAFLHWLLEKKVATEVMARKDRSHGHYTYQASYAKTDKKEYVTPVESAHQKSFFTAAALLEMYGAIYQKNALRFRIVKEIDEEIVEDLFDAIKNSDKLKEKKLLQTAEEKHRLDDALIVINVLVPRLSEKKPATSNENSNNIIEDKSTAFKRLVDHIDNPGNDPQLIRTYIGNILKENADFVIKNSIFCLNKNGLKHFFNDKEKNYAYWVGDYYHNQSTKTPSEEQSEILAIKAILFFLLPDQQITVNFARKEFIKRATKCLIAILSRRYSDINKLPFLDLFDIFVNEKDLFSKFLDIFFELQTKYNISHFVLAEIFYGANQFDLAEACFVGNNQTDTRLKHNLNLLSNTQPLSEPLSTYYYADIQFKKWQKNPQQTDLLETVCACYLQIALNGSNTSALTVASLDNLKKIDSQCSDIAYTRKYILAYYLSTDPAEIYNFSFSTIQLAAALTIIRPKLSAKEHNYISEVIFTLSDSNQSQDKKDELQTIAHSELHIAIEQGNQTAIAKAADPRFSAQLPLSLCAKLVDVLWAELQTINKETDPESYFETLRLLKSFVNNFTSHTPKDAQEEKAIADQLDKWTKTLDPSIFAFALANKSLSDKKLPENTDVLEELFYCLHDKDALEKIEQLVQIHPSFANKFDAFVLANLNNKELLLPILNSTILQNSLYEEVFVVLLFHSEILPFVDDSLLKQYSSKIIRFFEKWTNDPDTLQRISLAIFQKLLNNINNAEISAVVSILLQKDPTKFTPPIASYFKTKLSKKEAVETNLLLKIFLNHLDNPSAYILAHNALKQHFTQCMPTFKEHFESATFNHPEFSATLLTSSDELLAEIDVRLFDKLISPQSPLHLHLLQPTDPNITDLTAIYIFNRYRKLSKSPEFAQETIALLYNLYRLVVKDPSHFTILDNIADQFLDPLANFFCGCLRNKTPGGDFTKMKINFERSFQQSFPLPKVDVSLKQLPLKNSDDFNAKWEKTSGADIFVRVKSFIESHSKLDGFPFFTNTIDPSLSTYEDEVFLNIIEWVIAANKEASVQLNQRKYKSLAQDLWQIILVLNQPPCQFAAICEKAASLDVNAIEQLETEFTKHHKLERQARIQLIKCYVKGSRSTTFPYPDSYHKALIHINALVNYHEKDKNHIKDTIEYLNSLIDENFSDFQRVPVKVLAKLCLHSSELIIKYLNPIMRIYDLAASTTEADPEAKELVTQYENIMVRLLQDSTEFRDTTSAQQFATLLTQDNIFNQVNLLELINSYIQNKQLSYFTESFKAQKRHPLFPAITKAIMDAAQSETGSAMMNQLKSFADNKDVFSCFIYGCLLKIQDPNSAVANTYLKTAEAKDYILAAAINNNLEENIHFKQIWNKNNKANIKDRMISLFKERNPGFYSTIALSPNLIAKLEKLKNDHPLLILITLAIESTNMIIKDSNALEKMAFVIHEITNQAANHIPEPSKETDTTEAELESAVGFINEL